MTKLGESTINDGTHNYTDYIRIKAQIFGRVQGVGFRGFAKRYGNALGLAGWVKNLYDGSIEIVAEGEKTKIEKYITLLEKGPTWARVDRITVSRFKFKGDLDSFHVKY